MKSYKWLVLFLLVSLLVLSACQKGEDAVSENSVEVLVEETPMSSKTDDTREGSKAKSPETRLDVTAMLEGLGSYLLRPDDMPHSYYIPQDGEQHTGTIRLIQELGEIPAKTYVKDTGRIDGWWLQLKRVNKADFAPSTVMSSIELFESAEGAHKAISPTYAHLQMDSTGEYSPIDDGCDIGDNCEFYYAASEDPATEIVTVRYDIAFTYKNALVWVMAQGIEIDMEADYVLQAASTLLSKLETAPTQ